MINLNTILATMAFYNLEAYTDGISINFASAIQADKEAFISDFIINFTYEDMYCCYCIVNNPQSDNRTINAVSSHGHFIYQGNDFSNAIGKISDYYKEIEKINSLEAEPENSDDLEKKLHLEIEQKLKDAGFEIEKFSIYKRTDPEKKDDSCEIDITKN